MPLDSLGEELGRFALTLDCDNDKSRFRVFRIAQYFKDGSTIEQVLGYSHDSGNVRFGI
jgi:hypothetical protein